MFIGECRFTKFNLLSRSHCMIDDPGCLYDSECMDPTWKCCQGPCPYKECLPSTVSPLPAELIERQQQTLTGGSDIPPPPPPGYIHHPLPTSTNLTMTDSPNDVVLQDKATDNLTSTTQQPATGSSGLVQSGTTSKITQAIPTSQSPHREEPAEPPINHHRQALSDAPVFQQQPQHLHQPLQNNHQQQLQQQQQPLQQPQLQQQPLQQQSLQHQQLQQQPLQQQQPMQQQQSLEQQHLQHQMLQQQLQQQQPQQQQQPSQQPINNNIYGVSLTPSSNNFNSVFSQTGGHIPFLAPQFGQPQRQSIPVSRNAVVPPPNPSSDGITGQLFEGLNSVNQPILSDDHGNPGQNRFANDFTSVIGLRFGFKKR